MREILFRGKRIADGEWSEGDLRHGRYYRNDPTVYIVVPFAGTTVNHPVKPGTVGQYTGLKDKNGRRIFEGDIVTFGQNTYSIIFESGSFALYDRHGEIISKIGGCIDHCYPLMTLHFQCMWEDDWAYDIEVIGNIHDNPEMLEVR